MGWKGWMTEGSTCWKMQTWWLMALGWSLIPSFVKTVVSMEVVINGMGGGRPTSQGGGGEGGTAVGLGGGGAMMDGQRAGIGR